MSCPDCFRGSERADATPTGTVKTLHGLPTYVSEAPQGQPPKGIIVIIPDAWGWEFVNNRLLADEYARVGKFTVLIPDFMNGNACPLWVIEPMDSAMRTKSFFGVFTNIYDIVRTVYGFAPFMIRNRIGVTMPRVTNFLQALRTSEAANLPVGVAGFCWGGAHLMQLAAEAPGSNKPLVNACFAAHPSGLSFPKDIEPVKKPLSIAIGDQDPLMNPAQSQETQKILQKNGVAHEVVTYPGAGHGFSVRTDRTNPKQLEQAIQAEQQAIKWFVKYL